MSGLEAMAMLAIVVLICISISAFAMVASRRG